MISVLLPSRGRVELLQTSIQSLLDRADAVEDIEILIAADEDDSSTIDAAHSLCSHLIVTPRFGYGRLNEYYNQLAEKARGDWLLLWNDDAFMLTNQWDSILLNTPKGVLIADLQSQHSPGLCCFPAVRREAVKAVGGFSPHTPHCDTYWQDIGRATKTIQPVNIRLDHRRFDLSGENNDKTWTEGQSQYQTRSYYGSDVQGAIREDIEKIRRLI